MKFSEPLVEASLVRRYKRFFADCILRNGEQVTAHCPNTGSMMGVANPGSKIWLSHNPSPQRKLAYTWELTEENNTLIAVNTARPNHVVAEGIANGLIKELMGYDLIKREIPRGSSRIDLGLFSSTKPTCYVEIKSVTLSQSPGISSFPDAETTRGLKHIEELIKISSEGLRAVLFFCVNRTDAESFRPAASIDPAYTDGLKRANNAGVEILAYKTKISPENIVIDRRIAIDLN